MPHPTPPKAFAKLEREIDERVVGLQGWSEPGNVKIPWHLSLRSLGFHAP